MFLDASGFYIFDNKHVRNKSKIKKYTLIIVDVKVILHTVHTIYFLVT
jgi:hypothetical protein